MQTWQKNEKPSLKEPRHNLCVKMTTLPSWVMAVNTGRMMEIYSLIWCESLSLSVPGFFLRLKDDMPIWKKPI